MRLPFVMATLVALAALAFGAGAARAEPLTRVHINGTLTPVYFNDGDSFRIQAGPFRGAQARLSGYNTLESFGPVHSWGDWTTKETFVIAKLATLTARRGEWHCEGDGKKDTYGRLLLFCKDLAMHLIEKGLAHTYSVNSDPGDPDLMAVQRKAQAARVGMWAHGVPRFVMTSLHSRDEGGDKHGKTSNRLISTADAHSEKWEHEDTYAECQNVCYQIDVPTPTDHEKNAALLRADANVTAALAGLSDAQVRSLAAAVAEGVLRGAQRADELPSLGVKVPSSVTPAQAAAALEAAKKLHQDKKLLVSGKQTDSCHVYVDFRRRFGGERAVCLR